MVTACLAKDPSDRPAAITDVQAILDELAQVIPWDDDTAREWWSEHEPSV